MHHNHLLLAAGLLRNLIWVLGACVAYRTKRWMVASGFGLVAVNGLTFSFTSAHYTVPGWLNSLSVLVAAASAALIVVGFILGTGRYRYDHWHP